MEKKSQPSLGKKSFRQIYLLKSYLHCRHLLRTRFLESFSNDWKVAICLKGSAGKLLPFEGVNGTLARDLSSEEGEQGIPWIVQFLSLSEWSNAYNSHVYMISHNRLSSSLHQSWFLCGNFFAWKTPLCWGGPWWTRKCQINTGWRQSGRPERCYQLKMLTWDVSWGKKKNNICVLKGDIILLKCKRKCMFPVENWHRKKIIRKPSWHHLHCLYKFIYLFKKLF